MESFGEVLQKFKESEAAENLEPLIDDDDLRKGLVAWKSVRVTYKKITTEPDSEGKDDNSKWLWLWKQVEFNIQEFGVVAGVKAQDAGSMITRLKGFKLIYPDGTINSLAKQFLQARIMKQLSSGKKREPKQEQQKEPAK